MAALVSVRAKRVQVALGCIYPSLEGTPKIQPTFLGAHSLETPSERVPRPWLFVSWGAPSTPAPRPPRPSCELIRSQPFVLGQQGV